MLDALRARLMDPALSRVLWATIAAARAELGRIDCDLDKLVQALLDGVPGGRVKDRMAQLEARKAQLVDLVATTEEPPPLLHPNMTEFYRAKVAGLDVALNEEATRAEVAEILRSLVDAIILTPAEDELKIEVQGDLAGILAIANNAKSRPDRDGLVVQVEMVAGARYPLYRNRRKWIRS